MYVPKRRSSDAMPRINSVGVNADFQDPDRPRPTQPSVRAQGKLQRSWSEVERTRNMAEFYSDRAFEKMIRTDPDLIDREALTKAVKVWRNRMYGCLSLPISVAFFMLFAFCSFMHEDITQVYLIETGLRDQFTGSLVEADSVQDVWNWVNRTLVPKLFVQTDLLGQPLFDKSLWSRVLSYNQLQGPLLMEQLRSDRTPCNDGEGISGDMVCFPFDTRSRARFGHLANLTVSNPTPSEYAGGQATLQQRLDYYASSFNVHGDSDRRLRVARMEHMGELRTSPDKDKFRAYLYANTNYSLIQEHLNYLYWGGWLDMQSKQLVLKALLLNAEVGRPRLEQLQVTFFFSRGGGIFTMMTLRSLFLEMWPDTITLMSDIFWVTMLVGITAKEVRRLVKARWEEKTRRLLSKTSVLFEWLIILLGWLVIICYIIEEGKRQVVYTRLQEVVDAQTQDLPADVNTLGKDMHTETDSIIALRSWSRFLIAEYHLCLALRFFTAFRAQPRLGMVTGTLEASIIDIIHFLVVLLPTFMAYAVSGTFIFGRTLEEFSTFDSALGVCFKMLIEGEYDWPRISAESWWTAAFWVWSFMLLLVLLMLNMVLAIILEIYREIRKASGTSETVWVTFLHLVQRALYWKEWISTEELTEKTSMMPRIFTREELSKTFPNMCEPQLEGLIAICDGQDTEHSEGFGEAKRMQMAVSVQLERLEEELKKMEALKAIDPKLGWRGMGLEAAAVKRRAGWLHDVSERMAVQSHSMLAVLWQLQQLSWQWAGLEALCSKDGEFEAPQSAMSSQRAARDVVL